MNLDEALESMILFLRDMEADVARARKVFERCLEKVRASADGDND